LTPALTPQLGLLGSPPDPVGRFAMREGPSLSIVRAFPQRPVWGDLIRPNGHGPII
jgi:hypothetical protein